MRVINFDHASGYAVDERVIEEMLKYLREDYGNPSSTHSFGQKAKYVLEEARKKVASFINAESEKEIVFTSGATEANNLAIKGYAFRNAKKGKHIIISSIEHLSVINCAKYLQKHGFKITYLPVDEHGIVDLEALKEAITPETILISVMHANNEIGTVEPISEVAEIAQDKKIAFHCDATASCGKISVDVEKLGVSMLTISSNDLQGPRGVGALYIRRGIALEPVIHGGGQERGLRSGTENLAAIAGFAKACEIASKEMHANAEKMRELRDKIIDGVLSKIEETMLTGHREKRLPNHASFIFRYIEGESIVLSLDMEGILASSGSACTSKTLEPSHVLLALGLKHEEAHGSLSLTLGKENTIEDVNYFLDKLPPIIERLRAMSPLYKKKEVKT